jgi:hypothetical protein
MKKLLSVIVLACSVSGCASATCVEHGVHRQSVSPCVNDTLCVRDTYSVVWDNGGGCRNYSQDYPVSYRAKQTEYMLVPEATKNCNGDCGGVK